MLLIFDSIFLSPSFSIGKSNNSFNLKYAALALTVIGTFLALWVDIVQYENFLIAIGSVFAPLFAILLTEYFIIQNRQVQSDLLVNWSAFGVWAFGVVLYYQFIQLEFLLGATIPVMLVTGLFYKMIWGYTKEWKLYKA